ncbi:uncharacterized protein N7459_006558 [Penicillium hispanicum]|uniref:uncharacterized protein n=1 Tax=Penicillium hispanicum TaxID=1080232 RepID=UPI002540042D|nr:uncharacterized protein N7459_006558 [Penicillium hispanicum]KAJ5577594.1 hypothetical protein N7459_006558 [Penicillium hispanicum]
MPSLLRLPFELRELIIQQVVQGCHAPPAPSKSNRADFQDIKYRAWLDGPGGIYHERRSTHCPSNSLPLLLTCRQLSAETQSFLDRTGSTYILDISVLDEVDLLPTWLAVPRITNRVSTLRVNVRLFGHIISTEAARQQSGTGGHLGFHWSFYALLERFLQYGPVDEKKRPSQGNGPLAANPNFDDRDVTVKTLVLDFQSAEPKFPFPPDEVSYRRWRSQHFVMRRSRWHGELEEYKTPPQWPSTYLFFQIHALLSMGYHTALYGKILYERIGKIYLLVDGKPEREIDLADRLNKLRFTDRRDTFGHLPPEERLSTFAEWKKQTLARREQLGFPVIWPQD